jgi:hypothetical protein
MTMTTYGRSIKFREEQPMAAFAVNCQPGQLRLGSDDDINNGTLTVKTTKAPVVTNLSIRQVSYR